MRELLKNQGSPLRSNPPTFLPTFWSGWWSGMPAEVSVWNMSKSTKFWIYQLFPNSKWDIPTLFEKPPQNWGAGINWSAHTPPSMMARLSAATGKTRNIFILIILPSLCLTLRNGSLSKATALTTYRCTRSAGFLLWSSLSNLFWFLKFLSF